MTNGRLFLTATGVLFVAACLGCSDAGTSSSSSIRDELDQSPEKQKERKELIEKLINQGIFLKVEKQGTYPQLYVKPAFYELTIDEKTQFVGVVFAYCIVRDAEADLVLLEDGQSGKRIGTYSSRLGLDLD